MQSTTANVKLKNNSLRPILKSVNICEISLINGNYFTLPSIKKSFCFEMHVILQLNDFNMKISVDFLMPKIGLLYVKNVILI